MPRMKGRATIDRPPEEVFAFVADAENNPKWHAHVHETHWLDDLEMGLGRRGRQVGRLFGRQWEFVLAGRERGACGTRRDSSNSRRVRVGEEPRAFTQSFGSGS